MNKAENKNTLLAGVMNVLVPGSSQLYVNKDWQAFIRAFIIGFVAYAVAVSAGSLFGYTRGYNLPVGLFVSILVAMVAVVLFLRGRKIAQERNNQTSDAAFYNSKRRVSHETDQAKHAEIQKMRDEGLISVQEYDEKNAKVASDKK